jgi:hypothetical protein
VNVAAPLVPGGELRGHGAAGMRRDGRRPVEEEEKGGGRRLKEHLMCRPHTSAGERGEKREARRWAALGREGEGKRAARGERGGEGRWAAGRWGGKGVRLGLSFFLFRTFLKPTFKHFLIQTFYKF